MRSVVSRQGPDGVRRRHHLRRDTEQLGNITPTGWAARQRFALLTSGSARLRRVALARSAAAAEGSPISAGDTSSATVNNPARRVESVLKAALSRQRDAHAAADHQRKTFRALRACPRFPGRRHRPAGGRALAARQRRSHQPLSAFHQDRREGDGGAGNSGQSLTRIIALPDGCGPARYFRAGAISPVLARCFVLIFCALTVQRFDLNQIAPSPSGRQPREILAGDMALVAQAGPFLGPPPSCCSMATGSSAQAGCH